MGDAREDVADSRPGMSNANAASIQEVLQSISNIKSVLINGTFDSNVPMVSDVQKYLLKIDSNIEKYQDSPQLLDPYLSQIVSDIIALCRNVSVIDVPVRILAQIGQTMYTLCKVRGFKNICKYISPEVSDIHQIICLLRSISTERQIRISWEAEYLLLLWFSVAVLVPFDMNHLKSVSEIRAYENIETRNSPTLVMSKELEIYSSQDGLAILLLHAIQFIGAPPPNRRIACHVISNIFRRAGCESLFHRYILLWDEATRNYLNGDKFLSSSNALRDESEYFGLMESLCSNFKLSQRNVLSRYSDILWPRIKSFLSTDGDTQIRKLATKISVRFILSQLMPKLASWRYERGNRLLFSFDGTSEEEKLNYSQFKSSDGLKPQYKSMTNEQNDSKCSDNFVMLPSLCHKIELVITHLLKSLSDRDTVIRWSAAKGIGRITSRISNNMADDVVVAVLQLFRPNESESAWHGGCLAIAEFARRGVLLPERLPDVIPLLCIALEYDVPKGQISVGSNVRDAACYVCWSFARSYHPNILTPYIQKISCKLLIVCVLDREVNCRRAASAAFQEYVGRQRSIKHGIEIMSSADYFSVGNRNNAYLYAASHIASFDEYSWDLIHHLVQKKIFHWDKSIRELSAKTLGQICFTKPHYVSLAVYGESVISKNSVRNSHSRSVFHCDGILHKVLSKELVVRHGATLAIADVTRALAQNSIQFNFNLARKLIQLAPDIDKARLYRGKGGEAMRQACSRLIQCISCGKLSIENFESKLLLILEDNLRHQDQGIHEETIRAVEDFSKHYFLNPVLAPKFDSTNTYSILDKWLSFAEFEENPVVRRGFTAALGVLPREVLLLNVNAVLRTLCTGLRASMHRSGFTSFRVSCATSIQGVLENMGSIDCKSLALDSYTGILNALVEGANDSEVDDRGDVGSWVREASIKSLVCLFEMLGNSTNTILINFRISNVPNLMKCLLKEAGNKIDRAREISLNLLIKFLSLDACVNDKTQSELIDLRAIFSSSQRNDTAECHFYRLSQVLGIQTYRACVLEGLMSSMGGLSKSLSNIVINALKKYLNEQGKKHIDEIYTALHHLIQEKFDDKRFIVQVLESLALLTEGGFLEAALDSSRPNSVVHLTQEISGLLRSHSRISNDVQNLKRIIRIHYQFCKHGSKFLLQNVQALCEMLCNKFPTVRRFASEQLYLIFLSEDDLDVPQLEYAKELLLSTSWIGPVQELTSFQNKIANSLNIFVQTQDTPYFT